MLPLTHNSPRQETESLASMDKWVDHKRVESRSCLFQRLIRRQVAEDGSCRRNKNLSKSRGSFLDSSRADASVEEMASTSGIDRDPLMSSKEYVRDNKSLLSLQPWIFKKENCRDDSASPRNIGIDRSRGGFLRSRSLQRYSIKPHTSIKNYFTPQGYSENFKIEESVFSSLPSPPPTMRPFFITDGGRIISKSSFDSLRIQPGNGLHERVDGIGSGIPSDSVFQKEADGVSLEVMGAVIGVPPLPESRKPKRKSRKVQHGTLNASNSQRLNKVPHSEGSLDGMLLFCHGLRVGVMSTILSNIRELDKLNKLLKHTEDLVQDLQEELEMKDSLTVKELANGSSESQELNCCYSNIEESIDSFKKQNPSSHYTAQKTDECDHPHLSMAGENSESMSKIEAELEAELERLEQNMYACTLEQRISGLSELDPDLIADVVHGELRVDRLSTEVLETVANAHSDTNSTSTTQTDNANYSVSPEELSLRLHEVIQTRLEGRIGELEREILHTQRKLQFMEGVRVSPQRTFSNSDMGSSSNQESPKLTQSNGYLVHPLCLNLSGDALNAYDEAYEEFTRMAEEENPPPSINTGQWIERYKLNPSDRGPTSEHILWSRGCNGTLENDEDDDESDKLDDDDGMMLIQQIVEKTSKGSPVLTKAQRMLFFMDE